MNGDILSARRALLVDDDPQALLRELVRRKARFVGLLTVIYMTSYVGLTVLAGFARPFLAAHAVGPINLGFVLIGANYLLSWVLALVYVRAANSTFDPLVARVAATLATGGRAA